MQDKLKNGLDKIQETNDVVARMEVELTALRPELEQKQRDTEKLMIKLGEDQEKVGHLSIVSISHHFRHANIFFLFPVVLG